MSVLKPILWDCRWIALLSLAIMALGILLGFISYDLVKDDMIPVIKQVFGSVVAAKSDLLMIIQVFLTNTWASLALMILGVFILPTLLIMLSNGFVVGVVMTMSLEKGLTAGKLFLGIMPHGVFEIPAIILSASLGIRIAVKTILPAGRRRRIAFAQGVREAAAAYITVVLPLLVVAALVEVLVSKRLVLS